MSASSGGAPPQDLQEKLEPPVKPNDTVARCSLAKLRLRMWPTKPIPLEDPPEVLEFEVMGIREVWRRGSLLGGAAKEATVYALDRGGS